MMHNCGNCKTVLVTNIQWCPQCRRSCYCSKTCQVQHWKTHGKECGVTALSGWGNPTTADECFQKMPPNSIGGINDDWTSDLPRNQSIYSKAFERFINSFRLRMDDVYQHCQIKQGIYKNENPENLFITYYKLAKERKLLPRWWDIKCEKSMFAMAKLMIQKQLTKSQIESTHGPFEAMILRMMADKIYARPLNLR